MSHEKDAITQVCQGLKGNIKCFHSPGAAAGKGTAPGHSLNPSMTQPAWSSGVKRKQREGASEGFHSHLRFLTQAKFTKLILTPFSNPLIGGYRSKTV